MRQQVIRQPRKRYWRKPAAGAKHLTVARALTPRKCPPPACLRSPCALLHGYGFQGDAVARRAVFLVSHGDGRGRWLKHVYMQGMEA
jgi:hypothetical protein